MIMRSEIRSKATESLLYLMVARVQVRVRKIQNVCQQRAFI